MKKHATFLELLDEYHFNSCLKAVPASQADRVAYVLQAEAERFYFYFKKARLAVRIVYSVKLPLWAIRLGGRVSEDIIYVDREPDTIDSVLALIPGLNSTLSSQIIGIIKRRLPKSEEYPTLDMSRAATDISRGVAVNSISSKKPAITGDHMPSLPCAQDASNPPPEGFLDI